MIDDKTNTAGNYKFSKGFIPKNLIELHRNPRGTKIICAFEGVWNGKEVFNIRELYENDYAELAPGKGIMIPIEEKAAFLAKIREIK